MEWKKVCSGWRESEGAIEPPPRHAAARNGPLSAWVRAECVRTPRALG
jgi:hypothetical protein